jgi:RNA polymerase sigma-70 factor (ECF subfamily)
MTNTANAAPTPAGRDQIVYKAQAGDRAAYGELVRRFGPVVYAVAMTRLGNPAEAEEVAQEVFIHSMAKIRQLRDVRCFPGWLRQIAVRLALGRLARRRATVDGRPGILDDVPDKTTNPLDQLVRTEEQRRLRTTLRELNPLDRAVLEAFYLRSRSLRQMSKDFAAPIGTIKRRLHTARGRLRERLEALTPPAKIRNPKSEARNKSE